VGGCFGLSVGVGGGGEREGGVCGGRGSGMSFIYVDGGGSFSFGGAQGREKGSYEEEA